MKIGIDIGSTTIKAVVLDNARKVVYKDYQRHMSNVIIKLKEMVQDIYTKVGDVKAKVVMTGSGGLAISKALGIKFTQEVVSCSEAIEEIVPETDVAIELGGEDAKITFFGNSVEQQMNGSCAGGTGAFIDQMAVLLNTDALGLNEKAKNHSIIYPIAARCGVFAKTDIQPLINEGAKIEDLSASIFQAVVNQTISGLACGRPIRGKIAFLGGPLTFLSELRQRFIQTLDVAKEDVIFPEDSQYFVAMGAAFLSKSEKEISLGDLLQSTLALDSADIVDSNHLEPLFESEEDYDAFQKRHSQNKAIRRKMSDLKVGESIYLGIDAGSTTTKAVLIDAHKNILFEFYQSNQGNPLDVIRNLLTHIYQMLPEGVQIAYSGVTGYGEGLIKAAFHVDMGEIETIAHYKGAEHFLNGVDFILDIGGQDMKCMRVKDGVIQNIMLNEACSSGCGSFIETYAKSLGSDVQNFAKEALSSKQPVDLGTRCTVFMNSKVKQAQKEGATIGDISAGLSYSVIKNALYKVIKLRDSSQAGDKIVVQGGTFLNEAVLRSMEKVIGREVVRPDISGLMGAFGVAILALENYEGQESSLAKLKDLEAFQVKHSNARCGLCENNCLLTINTFDNGSRFITGNRCEKGSGNYNAKNKLPDMYEYKYLRLFSYQPIATEAAKGIIGLPRVLNMYENYPFWFTLFTHLGYRVEISDTSSKEMYEKGMDTIASDTACYPAKLVHGHIKNLIDKGIKTIFYPNINFEYSEDDSAPNHFNCPVVATYPELIKNNMDDILAENDVKLISPFLPFDHNKKLINALYKVLNETLIGDGQKKISKKLIEEGVYKGREAYQKYRQDVCDEASKYLQIAKEKGLKVVVLSGRPYHLDPEINHSINRLITSLGMIVLSEDSILDKVELPRPLRVLDQWMYHSRLYKAAEFVGKEDDVEIVQLNSFGCGLDAVTTDQVEEILHKYGKLYTVLKIDEGNNLGAAKIRLRSLKAAIVERDKHEAKGEVARRDKDVDLTWKVKDFTQEMAEEYTMLMPQMSPIHFQFFETALQTAGYKAKMLPAVSESAIAEGLKYINNDACYPTIVALGQIIAQLKSGEEDLDKTAIFMSQTGGGCRASNYVALLRKALKDLNMEQIPVVSINPGHLEQNSGFKMTLPIAFRMVLSILYGDLFMQVLFRTRPYEKVKGSADALMAKWTKVARENVANGSIAEFRKNMITIVEAFDSLEINEDIRKPKVGVVGEILVKYHPTANNDIIGIIEREGGEAVVLDLIDFFTAFMYNKAYNYKHLNGSYKYMLMNSIGINLLDQLRKPYLKALDKSKRFHRPAPIKDIAKKAETILSLGNQCGEGWLLTGEMVELLEMGVDNIVCLQPFACLPNHITGKGMIKPLKKRFEMANIAAIDYDPGASSVNQLNRIKLMMATAHKNLEKKEAGLFV